MALVTATETMGSRLSDLLKYETNPTLCRETVTMTAAVRAGTVLGRTKLGRTVGTVEYKAHDPEATDGSEIARAVALFDAPAYGACIVVRRSAVVAKDALIWKAGMSDYHKAAALVQLADAGIVALDVA